MYLSFSGLPIFFFLDLVTFLRPTIPVSIFCEAVRVIFFLQIFWKAQEYSS